MMFDTGETPNPDTLHKIHKVQTRMLGSADLYIKSSNHKGKSALYDELVARSAAVAGHLKDGAHALAAEVMYGIAMGIDGLHTRWGAPKTEADMG